MSAQELDSLVGAAWNGTLTYRDYTSGASTTIRATLQVTPTNQSGAWTLAIGYPGEPHANTSEVFTRSVDGRQFAGEQVVERTTQGDAVRLVTEGDGMDDELPVRIRHVYAFDADAVSMQKLVRRAADQDFFERHIYRWTRVPR